MAILILVIFLNRSHKAIYSTIKSKISILSHKAMAISHLTNVMRHTFEISKTLLGEFWDAFFNTTFIKQAAHFIEIAVVVWDSGDFNQY